ncbi:MAG: ATP-dependent helicase, partial [Fimbriimonadaceae bacterium]|nr:ATP-dependent helicase [Alphaproteobacteria bacterium]
LLNDFERWRSMVDSSPHTELAEIILDESGYTAMWQNDRAADAPGRLENLKELVRSMEGFDSLAGFLEHISLVMDVEAGGEQEDRVSLMTLHAAKGLEFDTVFLPGWEEGLFPHQRALDDAGRAGLEEERRLAYVGLTRAKKNARISFAQNRRVHALWQTAMPSRFLDELPEANVEVEESDNHYGGYMSEGYSRGGYGASRFDTQEPSFSGSYDTPGWQRAQRNKGKSTGGYSRGPQQIEGELVGASSNSGNGFALGERVFHLKFGYGEVMAMDGDKLTIEFDKAGTKKVLASFLERH